MKLLVNFVDFATLEEAQDGREGEDTSLCTLPVHLAHGPFATVINKKQRLTTPNDRKMDTKNVPGVHHVGFACENEREGVGRGREEPKPVQKKDKYK